VEGVDRGLAQGASEQDSTVGLAGEINESGQAAGETGDGAGRIENDQADVQAANETGQVVQVLGESVRAAAGEGQGRILDERTYELDMVRNAPGRLEAWFEDVGGRVVRSQEEDVALLGGRTVRQGRAAGDASGQGEGHEGEARARGSIEQGEVTEGDATGPQPGERFVRHLIEEADGGLGSRRFLRLLFGM